MTYVWGALCILFAIISIYAFAFFLRSIGKRDWKGAAISAAFLTLFAGQAANFYEGFQGRELASEDPRTPRLR